MQKGPGWHDMWFRVICIWNLRQNKSKMAEALRYAHSRSDFYGFNWYFRTFITSIMLFGEWSGQKCLKLKMDKICRPGPFHMTRPSLDTTNSRGTTLHVARTSKFSGLHEVHNNLINYSTLYWFFTVGGTKALPFPFICVLTSSPVNTKEFKQPRRLRHIKLHFKINISPVMTV